MAEPIFSSIDIFPVDANISITVGAADSQKPKSNLQDANPAITTQSTGLSYRINIDMGTPTAIVGVVVINNNMTSLVTTFKFREGTTSGTVDSQTDLPQVQNSKLLISKTKQYYAIDMIKSSGTDYPEAGNIYLFTANTILTGTLCPGRITNNYSIKETNNEIGTANQFYREIKGSPAENFSFEFTKLIQSDLAILKDIANQAYTCFEPYGSDDLVFYGAFRLSSIVQISDDKTPFSNTDFTSSGTFTENPA